MPDPANASIRVAPGAPGTSFKITFANGANAATQLRAAPANNALSAFRYISIKTTAGVCIATGDSTVAASTTNDPRYDSTDGWQDMVLLPGVTHIRPFGDGTGGTLYVWLSGE